MEPKTTSQTSCPHLRDSVTLGKKMESQETEFVIHQYFSLSLGKDSFSRVLNKNYPKHLHCQEKPCLHWDQAV